MRHDSVVPEHQLLGLLAIADSIAAGVLAELGIYGEMVRSKLVERMPPAAAAVTDQPLPYSQPAKEVLGWACYAAAALDSDHIGTDHLLLGIVRVCERGGSEILDDLGIDPETLRIAVEKRAAAGGSSEPPQIPRSPTTGSAADDRGPRVSVNEVPTKRYGSAPALARALGSVVLEPDWWPQDATEIDYRLIGWPRGDGYSITGTRPGGVPVGINAHPKPPGAQHPERPEAGLALGDWRAPSELAEMRGLIGWVGFPPQLEAVVHAEKMRIHFAGYESEADILRAAKASSDARPASASPALRAPAQPGPSAGRHDSSDRFHSTHYLRDGGGMHASRGYRARSERRGPGRDDATGASQKPEGCKHWSGSDAHGISVVAPGQSRPG